MEEKTKVALIGMNSELLSTLAEKINSSRPVELVYFTDLKDFLENSIDNKPDIIGVSVNFPHKSITRFPKLFRMALNTKVLTFGENQDNKSRKLLNSIQSDYKIQGKLNAHNLWMKILNILKEQEKERDRLENNQDFDESKKKSNMVFLKDSLNSNNKEKNKNSLLNSLYKALDENDPEKSESDLNLIKSSSATKYKKKNLNHIGLGAEEEKPQEVEKKSNTAHIKGEKRKENPKKENEFNKDIKPEIGTDETDLPIKSKKPNLPPEIPNKDSTNRAMPFPSDSKQKSLNDSKTQNPSLLKAAKSFSEMLNEDDDGYKTTTQKSPVSLNQSEFPTSVGDSDGDIGASSGKKSFGKVKLADEDEVKQEDLRRNKERTEQENLKKNNILVASCELGLKKNFNSTPSNSGGFVDQVDQVQVYILESGNYKGYLVIAHSGGDLGEKVEDFRKTLIDNMKKNGMSCELSKATGIPLEVDNYSMTVKEFSEFSINSIGEKSYFNISFVAREALRPSFQESDNKDMYIVDIKVIPPKTIVNFDAYIYLPMNKRFVRYLKAGRSLSLKQSKRFSEDVLRSKLYLPKNQKEQLISFFIQNTLDWEFTLHQKNEVA